jgi:hypothetical protein
MPQIANWPKTRAEAQAILQSHPNSDSTELHTCKVCGDTYWCPPNSLNGRFRSFCSRRCYHRYRETKPSFQRYRQSDKGKAMRRQVMQKTSSRPEVKARAAQHQRWVKFVLAVDRSQRPFNTTPWPTCTTADCHNIPISRASERCGPCTRQRRIANRPSTWRNAGKPCQTCGKPLGRYQAKYCSKTCQRRLSHKKYKERHPDAYRAARRRRKKNRSLKRRTVKLQKAQNGEFIRQCLQCDKTFDAFRMKGRIPKFCGKKCENRAHELRRRARKRSVFIEVVSVKKLLKWQHGKCYHCGYKINTGKSAPHPKSLTIDHLVPLSLGGDHSYANTVASCWKCNCAIKGARAIDEQLKLL